MGGLWSRGGDRALTGNVSLEVVAEKIKSGEIKNICFMTGAGISTAAGELIWDHRRRGIGKLIEQGNVEGGMDDRIIIDILNPRSHF